MQPCGGLCRLTLQFQVHFRIRAMSQGICDKLDEMSKRIFQSQNVDDAVFESVYSKACSLVTQVAVQRKLESTAQLVRDNGILPVRRVNINIKKLSKSDDEPGEQGRWRRLQKQDCETLIFCTLSFSGLVLLSEEQFSWLVENARAYLEAQSLPSGWIAREQIRTVVARTPRQPNTRSFLESQLHHCFPKQNAAFDQFPGYHKVEIHYDSVPEIEPRNKRPRIGSAFHLQPVRDGTDSSS